MNNRRIEIIIGTKGPDCEKAVGQKSKKPDYHQGAVTINHQSVGR